MDPWDELDYSKLPYRPSKGWLQKLFCSIGLHIPVEVIDQDDEVYCQECVKTLNKTYHDKFFSRARR